MKKIMILLLLCLAQWSMAQMPSDVIRKKITEGDHSTVLVVAHRGDWRYAPENSLAAIEHSIKIGVDIVEVDLQMTMDSVLILMHDASLDRTTTGKGKVSDWCMDSIRSLNLKNGCGIRAKDRVPTLEEVLQLAKGRVMLNLDKADRYFDLVLPLLEKTNTTNQIIMKGTKSAAEVKTLYGAYLDKVIYMPIINLDRPNVEEMISDFEKLISPPAHELIYVSDTNPRPKQLATKLDKGTLKWYNTLWDTLCGGHDDDLALEDPQAAFGYLIDSLGARIIQTDRAQLLLDYLRSRGLHD